MVDSKVEVLRRLLKPISHERAAEIMRERVSSGEQLPLEDAGLTEEVRQILEGQDVAPRNAR